MKEARKAGVKVSTRLNSNFVVVQFGAEFRKEDILSNIEPIRRMIDGKSYIIYAFKRCIWQGTAGKPFLARGEGYDDFIPLFTTPLNTKPETAIMKYKERASIEQTNKELKSYLGIEGNYFRTKKSNYGYIFLLCLVYNSIQYVRLYLTDMIILSGNCRIGTHLVIMPGVTIDENSIVGAFSFVNEDIPDNVVAVGVPAKVIKGTKE
jgi:hypothetical protein